MKKQENNFFRDYRKDISNHLALWTIILILIFYTKVVSSLTKVTQFGTHKKVLYSSILLQIVYMQQDPKKPARGIIYAIRFKKPARSYRCAKINKDLVAR